MSHVSHSSGSKTHHENSGDKSDGKSRSSKSYQEKSHLSKTYQEKPSGKSYQGKPQSGETHSESRGKSHNKPHRTLQEELSYFKGKSDAQKHQIFTLNSQIKDLKKQLAYSQGLVTSLVTGNNDRSVPASSISMPLDPFASTMNPPAHPTTDRFSSFGDHGSGRGRGRGRGRDRSSRHHSRPLDISEIGW